MKIIVTGGSGMVGKCLQDICKDSQYTDNEFFFYLRKIVI